MSERPSTTLPGTVEKIVKSPVPSKPDKAQIAVEGADDGHKKISIENRLTDKNGGIAAEKQYHHERGLDPAGKD